MTELDPDTRVRWAGQVLSRAILDEAVLLNPECGLYFGINSSGSLLWSAMAEGVSAGELVRLLVERFGISDEQAWGDVSRFVNELGRHGLVEILAP